jgi:broad specificity phosphatase PhoE
VDCIYSSPITSACETAAIIGSELWVPLQLCERLVELDAGQLEGLTFEEMRYRYPEFMALWNRDRVNAVIPVGESLLHIEQRVDSFYRFIKAGHSCGNIVVCFIISLYAY